MLAGIISNIGTLLSRLTSARAGYLDRLDATITSRLASNDSRLNNLDATISTRATPTQVNSEVHNRLNTAVPVSPVADSMYERIKTLDDAYTTTRAGYLDRLDTTITSRLASNDSRLNMLKAQRIKSLRTEVSSTTLVEILSVSGTGGQLISVGWNSSTGYDSRLNNLVVNIDGQGEEILTQADTYSFRTSFASSDGATPNRHYGVIPLGSRFNSSLVVKVNGADADPLHVNVIYSIDI